MQRRQFIEAGMLAGAALGVPATALAAGSRAAGAGAPCSVSSIARADRIAAAIAASGTRVIRASDEPTALWYDHVAPGLEAGRAMELVLGENAGFMLGQLAHLRGLIAPSERHAEIARLAGMEAWRIRPRILRGHGGIA